ncbi:MAG TPA: transposase [Syntrophales bacterium]|nr:transposase [Syntrophales bacterium]
METNGLAEIDGIAAGTATTFLAEIGNIGNCSSCKNLIAFTGMDPTVYQSGKYEGKLGGAIFQTIPNAGQVIIRAEPLFAKD